MALSESSTLSNTSSDEELFELYGGFPQWQRQEFKREMHVWKETLGDVPDEDQDQPYPSIVECFRERPKAAFLFHSIASVIGKWAAARRSVESLPERHFDATAWLVKNEDKLMLSLRDLISSIETDLQDGRFHDQVCIMEIKSVNRAIYDRNETSTEWGVTTAKGTCLAKLVPALIATLNPDISSTDNNPKIRDGGERYRRTDRWTLHEDICLHLFSTFIDASVALQALLQRFQSKVDSTRAQNTTISPVDEATTTQSGRLQYSDTNFERLNVW